MARDQLRGKIRLLSRIRGFMDQELASSQCSSVINVGVSRSDEKVAISFDDPTTSRKNEYYFDCCYGPADDNTVIFSKEVKPHISRVFAGVSSSFIAFGARASGKTHLVQGTKENFGLGLLAMDEVLRNVEGGRYAVAVSICKVTQNHVVDLLDTNKEVQILEDAQGKITLKGLSKVHVKSMAEFQKLYCGESRSMKSAKKIPHELPRRSHKALMIHIIASDEGEHEKCIGKLNFLDLAGYENCVEGTENNKSLIGLITVLNAINSSECRVPFRESKVARIIQDDVGGTNNISVLFCLNPLFCQDDINILNLALRLKNVKSATTYCSAKKNFTGANVSTIKKQTNPWYSFHTTKPSSSCASVSANKPNPGVSTTKKQTNPRFPLSEKRTNAVQKQRQPFGGVEQRKGIKEQALSMEMNETSIMKSGISGGDFTVVPPQMEDKCSFNEVSCSSASVPQPLDEMFEGPLSAPPKECTGTLEPFEESPPMSAQIKAFREEVLKPFLSSMGSRRPLEAIVDDCSSHGRKEESSLVSAQIKAFREEVLKPFLSSMGFRRPLEAIVDDCEPTTPVVTHIMESPTIIEDSETPVVTHMESPTVEDCLRFLNSAKEDSLKTIWGIGEKRATYILERREESLEPFKSLADLQDIGLSEKQVKKMMNSVAKMLQKCCQ